MTRPKNKSGGPSEITPSNVAPHPFEKHIQRLEELRQPWNPVIRAAMDLLKRRNSHDYCEVVSIRYGYAETVQQNGEWKHSSLSRHDLKLSDHARRNAVGIVLDGRVEVIGRQPIPNQVGGCSISPAQPRHMISMEKGEVLGSYEFTGNLFQHPETHEYEVLSGPVCIQFDHEQFNAFSQNKTTTGREDNLAKCATSLGKLQTSAFKQWWTSGENHYLIEAFAQESQIKVTHSELLFINLKFPYFEHAEDRHAWESFRNVIFETAWRQSRASRGRDFKASSVPHKDCIKPKQLNTADKRNAIDIEAHKATLIHLDEVVNGVGTLWSELQDPARFPALASFLESGALNCLKITAEKVFIKEPLLSLPKKKKGRLSIVDYISRYTHLDREGKADFEGRIEGNKLTDWKFVNLLNNSDLLDALKKHLDSSVKSLRERNPGALSEIDLKQAAKSGNPFQHLWIEVDSGLDTLPSLKWVEEKIGGELNLGETLIIACQHFLRETCAWFAHLMSKGATIIAIGKDYSTCPEVARRLQRIGVTVVESPSWEWKPGEYAAHLEAKAKLAWAEASKVFAERHFKEVIVVDDGGVLHKTANGCIDSINAPKLCGVEQTTSGEINAIKAPYPVALISRHTEKRTWESRIIADKIFENSLQQCGSLSGTNKTIGIIGAGAIADAVAEKFLEDGYSVFWFSEKFELKGKCNKKQTLEELLDTTEVIFGCTGDDVLKELLGRPERQMHLAGKWFISCSSGDTEFASLLKLKDGTTALCSPLRLHNPFSTMVVHTKPNPCFVLNGGFPINFDRERDSVPLHLIQFTRALMHLGLVKARDLDSKSDVNADKVTWADFQKDVLNIAAK